MVSAVQPGWFNITNKIQVRNRNRLPVNGKHECFKEYFRDKGYFMDMKMKPLLGRPVRPEILKKTLHISRLMSNQEGVILGQIGKKCRFSICQSRFSEVLKGFLARWIDLVIGLNIPDYEGCDPEILVHQNFMVFGTKGKNLRSRTFADIQIV